MEEIMGDEPDKDDDKAYLSIFFRYTCLCM